MKKSYLLMAMALVLMLVGAPWTLAQDRTVSGKVTDNTGQTVPGASVSVKGKPAKGAVTNFDGEYTLDGLSSEDVLVFSFIGLKPQEIQVGQQSVINVMMEEDLQTLEEVVVVGYGTTKEKELTGSVSVVGGEAIEQLKPTRVEQALQGQTPGVQISSASGSPGGGFNVRIRGISTNGDNAPLILVDGVRYQDLGAIDPNSIKNITVLKDASASIYGVQGANGVILVTTKSGKRDMKPTLSINSYYGVQETSRKIPVLNATEYSALINESHVNGGDQPPFNNIDVGEGTDWQDEVFEQAPIQQHTLNLTGGGSKSTYAVGAGYFDQRGIVGGDASQFQRYTANLNSTYDIVEQLKLTAVANYTHQKRRSLPELGNSSVLFNALNMNPTATVRDANGDFTRASSTLGGEVVNPVALIDNTYNRYVDNRLNGKAGLNWDIGNTLGVEQLEGLSASYTLGFQYFNSRFKSFSPIVDYGETKVRNNPRSSVTEVQQIGTQLTSTFLLNYERTFANDHNVKLMAGQEAFVDKFENLSATGFDIPNNSWEFADISQAQAFDENGAAGSFTGDFRLLSYLFRGEYNYKGKYFFSGLLRRDGTSRFGDENKFGWFYAVSGAWIISDEAFMDQFRFIDLLKLRASYGETGSDKIGDFRFVSLLNGEAEYPFNGGTITQGQAIGAITNPGIQWERNTQLNVGLDAEFFEGRVRVSGDYFRKESLDLLLSVPVAGIAGAAAPGSAPPVANTGSIRNQGIELATTLRHTFANDLNVSFNYNLTYLQNTTISLANGVDFIEGGSFGIGQPAPTRWEQDQPIGYYYGLETAGIFQTQEDVESYTWTNPETGQIEVIQPDAQPGDLRYVDNNNDGSIDVNDRKKIGNPIPDWVMGMGLNADWKGFDFSIFADVQMGNQIIRNFERNERQTNRPAYYLDRWNGPGTSNDFPRISTGANDNDLFSDFWVEDGDYLRIKNIQIGYTLPLEISEKIKASKVRFYATVNNLVTFTEYRGFDPNVSTGNALAAGIDDGFYPQARSYLFGLNLTF